MSRFQNLSVGLIVATALVAATFVYIAMTRKPTAAMPADEVPPVIDFDSPDLDFENRSLSPDDMRRIGGEQKVLGYLRMPPNTTDDDLQLLRGLTVTSLSLSYSKVRGPGLIHLAEVHGIRYLSLAWTNLDDEGLAYLPGMDTVRTLLLSGTGITDAGVKTLFSNRFSQVEEVCMQNTSIGDQTIEVLRNMKQLTSLNVYHTNVSDAALGTVEEMSESRVFACGLSRVSPAGVARLTTKIPHLKVDYGD